MAAVQHRRVAVQLHEDAVRLCKAAVGLERVGQSVEGAGQYAPRRRFELDCIKPHNNHEAILRPLCPTLDTYTHDATAASGLMHAADAGKRSPEGSTASRRKVHGCIEHASVARHDKV